MDVLTALRHYFQNERNIGFVLIPVGMALLGMAFWFYRSYKGEFLWPLFVIVFLMGMGGVGGGIGQIIRNQAFEKDLTALHQQTPNAVVAKELPRMAKVNANWPRLKLVWAGLLLLGLAFLFGVKREWSTSLALGLFLLGTTGMFIDIFAEKQAMVYTQALEAHKSRHP